jgi:glucosamine-phosphate N-acetyltransferase
MVNNLIEVSLVKKEQMSEVIDLLQSISEFKPKSDQYDRIWSDFDSQPNVHAVVAVLDNLVVGYGSVTIETKIRGGKIGHIEDIVTHPDFRQQGIGITILDRLYEIGRENGTFKFALECKEHNVPFYEKCDYVLSGVSMQRHK